uniref:Signal peptidase complex catalytic subunit SEC11 n=1 Tax=Ditylenchus dipsaci TaxID=166011 RepID=A0A915E908_9BILA
MGIFDYAIFDEVRRMNGRQLVYQFLNFAMIVSSALMIWKGLMVVTGSESPIVVVLSGSMEPAFFRGDLLVLTNDVEDPIRAGDITVFKIEGRDIPIVHRVIKVHEKGTDNTKFLTKGDHNLVDDRGLYAPGQYWLERKDVVGRARGLYHMWAW